MTSISEILKLKRKMLGLSKKKVAEDLDMSVEEVEECENLKPQELISHDKIETAKPKRYIVGFFEYDEVKEGEKGESFRDLELFDFEGFDLLRKELRAWADYTVEFTARIKPSNRILHDRIDDLRYRDTDILEIIEIKKVKE